MNKQEAQIRLKIFQELHESIMDTKDLKKIDILEEVQRIVLEDLLPTNKEKIK